MPRISGKKAKRRLQLREAQKRRRDRLKAEKRRFLQIVVPDDLLKALQTYCTSQNLPLAEGAASLIAQALNVTIPLHVVDTSTVALQTSETAIEASFPTEPPLPPEPLLSESLEPQPSATEPFDLLENSHESLEEDEQYPEKHYPQELESDSLDSSLSEADDEPNWDIESNDEDNEDDEIDKAPASAHIGSAKPEPSRKEHNDSQLTFF